MHGVIAIWKSIQTIVYASEKKVWRLRSQFGSEESRSLMGTGVPIFRQEDNYRFVDNPTQAIRLRINKTRSRNRTTMSSLGYQPCTARLTLPRRLILACESKNTSKNKEEHNQIVDEWLNSRVGVSQTDLAANCSVQNNLNKTQTLTRVWRMLRNSLGSCKTPGRAPNGLQHDTRPKDRKTASQRRDSNWTLNSSDYSHWLRMNLGLKLVPLEATSNYLSIHIKNVQIRLHLRPGHLFYYWMLLDSESDSKLNRFGPPPCLGRPCWSPKVVAKGKDILGHLWSPLHMFETSSNMGLAPMCGLYLQANNDMYMWNQVNCIWNHYANVRANSLYNQCSYPKVSCAHHSWTIMYLHWISFVTYLVNLGDGDWIVLKDPEESYLLPEPRCKTYL